LALSPSHKSRKRQPAAPLGSQVSVAGVVWLRGKTKRRGTDSLAVEEPLEIRVRGRSVAVTMRTPGHDDELAAGFLLTESILSTRAEVIEIAPCLRQGAGMRANIINVFLAAGVKVDFDHLTRHVFASSSCGLCGKASIDAVHAHFPPVKQGGNVSAATLSRLPARLRSAQAIFDRTGGLHAAAIFDRAGKLVVLREDVGRHNAVDKVIGYGLLNGLLPYEDQILLVSGRASFEILQKALAGRIPVVAAVSAPSSLAQEFAQESGQTLIGFLRPGRMNIYTHPDRITP
jgi:FdhD protein